MKTIKISPLRKSIVGEVVIPGSKSLTNRALIMASLAKGVSKITGISKSDDSGVLITALKKIGIKIRQNANTVEIVGNDSNFTRFKGELKVGNAGTVTRFLISLACQIPGEISIDGSARIRERPVRDLVEALILMGAKIKYLGKKGFLPIVVRGGRLKGGTVSIKGNVSSQFISSLLIIAPLLKNSLTLKIIGKQVSKSYIDMTTDLMEKFGIEVEKNDLKSYFINTNQKYKAIDYEVDGDASGASYFFAIAALTGSRIKVKNIDPQSKQGDIEFTKILKNMGCLVSENIIEKWIELEGPSSLKGIVVDMTLMPDTAQTLAVVAAFAKGTTKITGLQTLKIKETDRLTALKNELLKIGIISKITNNSITIQGGRPHKATIETYNDHRMAMSFAMAGTKISGIKIQNPEVVNKSFPEFWRQLKILGVKIR
jgi:3-phosphoshikimate 1-carboxyvinyltransferase